MKELAKLAAIAIVIPRIPGLSSASCFFLSLLYGSFFPEGKKQTGGEVG
jgi:hypothetical protein